MSKFKPVNYYEKMDKKYMDGCGRTYPSHKSIHIDIPFRMLIIGASGSGKTNTLMNLIKHMECFTKFYIFARNIDQPLYKFFIDNLVNLAKKLDVDQEEVFTVSTDLEQLPPLEDFDAENDNLVILDDFVTEKKTMLKKVSDLFIRSRPFNVSVIFLSQSFYDVPKLIRQNADYIILKRINMNNDLKLIAREYCGGNIKHVTDLYNQVQTKGLEHFLLIDRKTTNPKLMYRIDYG